MSHAKTFLEEAASIAYAIDYAQVGRMANDLHELRERGGRLFLIGLGGSAANCQHAAADFQKLCDLNAISLVDSMAAFSARANDEGLECVFLSMLKTLKLSAKDALMVFSVGGGTPQVSRSISNAIGFARGVGARVLGIVGHHGGDTHELGTCVVRIPLVNAKHITPHSEAFQAVIWHCLVSHPQLQRHDTKW